MSTSSKSCPRLPPRKLLPFTRWNVNKKNENIHIFVIGGFIDHRSWASIKLLAHRFTFDLTVMMRMDGKCILDLNIESISCNCDYLTISESLIRRKKKTRQYLESKYFFPSEWKPFWFKSEINTFGTFLLYQNLQP